MRKSRIEPEKKSPSKPEKKPPTKTKIKTSLKAGGGRHGGHAVHG